MAGVDYLETLDCVDPSRLGITGGWYGGYMTNWVIGQTERFKVAVTERSTCNRFSLYGTSELEHDVQRLGVSWRTVGEPEFYSERSPITYVKNITTPLLILHSENDLRCPISQGEEHSCASEARTTTSSLCASPTKATIFHARGSRNTASNALSDCVAGSMRDCDGEARG